MNKAFQLCDLFYYEWTCSCRPSYINECLVSMPHVLELESVFCDSTAVVFKIVYINCEFVGCNIHICHIWCFFHISYVSVKLPPCFVLCFVEMKHNYVTVIWMVCIYTCRHTHGRLLFSHTHLRDCGTDSLLHLLLECVEISVSQLYFSEETF